MKVGLDQPSIREKLSNTKAKTKSKEQNDTGWYRVSRKLRPLRLAVIGWLDKTRFKQTDVLTSEFDTYLVDKENSRQCPILAIFCPR